MDEVGSSSTRDVLLPISVLSSFRIVPFGLLFMFAVSGNIRCCLIRNNGTMTMPA